MADASKYIVSARKYRPATFNSVVGQKNLTSTLKNAIASGRVAQAYLFCGPRGVGKTSCARIFAKTINCLSPTADGEACGECESCRSIDRGNSYNLIELDAASNNSVDDIRAVTEQVNIPPQIGKYRVFIIDEVHMLTSQAFNAFLKTLEEPPAYAVFILATTEKHKVIPTILSRCQIYDFKRITLDDTIEHLEYVAKSEGIAAERRALDIIARKADGAMRDALSIFDQVAASCNGNVTYQETIENLNVLDYEYFFKLIDAFAKGDIPTSLLLYKDIRDKGFDSLFFINGLASHVRDLMVAANPATLPLLEMASDIADRFKAQASSLPLQWYYAAMKILNDCDFNYRVASNKQLLVEVTLIRLCQLMAPADPPFKGTYRNPPLQSTVTSKTGANTAPVSSAPVVTANPSTSTATDAPPANKASEPPQNYSAKQDLHANKTRVSASRPRTFKVSVEDTRKSSSLNPRNEIVSISDFMDVWNKYIEEHPEELLLTSAMRQAKIEQTEATLFKVLVSHPGARQSFETAHKLVETLRGALNNDFIQIRAEIDPENAVQTQLPPSEFLAKAMAENPALGDFLRTLDPEIA